MRSDQYIKCYRKVTSQVLLEATCDLRSSFYKVEVTETRQQIICKVSP